VPNSAHGAVKTGLKRPTLSCLRGSSGRHAVQAQFGLAATNPRSVQPTVVAVGDSPLILQDHSHTAAVPVPNEGHKVDRGCEPADADSVTQSLPSVAASAHSHSKGAQESIHAEHFDRKS